MNPRVTVGLLAILVALAAYVYFGAPPASSSDPAAKGKPTDPPPDVWQLEEGQIQTVTVRRGDQEAGVQRAGEDWQLLPSGEPADRLRVNSLVFRLASLRATRRLNDVTNLAEFGLAPPAMVATVRLANGESQTLELGGKAPAESGTYVRKAGDPAVYVISSATAQDLERLLTEPPRPLTPTPAASPEASPSPSPSP